MNLEAFSEIQTIDKTDKAIENETETERMGGESERNDFIIHFECMPNCAVITC